MKVLLVGEASRVHRNLKVGLVALGVECLHMVNSDSIPWREFDAAFAPARNGIVGGVARNLVPFAKFRALGSFDVIGFANTITAIHGRYAKYWDLPLFRRRARLMSYYALSCDEIGLIRKNPALPYAPCLGCLGSDDTFSRDCTGLYAPRYEKSVGLVRKYFDYGACSMVEYDHVADLFGRNFCRIPLPVDAARIPFSPAKDRAKVNVIHTPTRRGFKGTATVLEAVEMLRQKRDDFTFEVIEGLPYDKYVARMAEADVVVDQINSQSPGMNGLEMMAAGKVVLTGATALGNAYFEFMRDSPAFDAPPDARGLADQLEIVLDRRAEFPALAERGRAYVERNHSVRAVAETFLGEWKARL